MAIHLARNNMLKGSGSPLNKISPEFYGQTFVDTTSNMRDIYIATSEDSSGWKKISINGHKHTVSDFSDLQPEIVKLVQQQGIEAALTKLLGGNNTWEGAWNNFLGEVRSNGRPVLTKNSSIGDLIDVQLGDKLKANSLLGFNGSNFVPYEVSGASPSTGGIDFSKYLRKDDIVNEIGNNQTDKPLSAAAGTLLSKQIKENYATIDHSHTGYALKEHNHEKYLDKTISQIIEGKLVIGNENEREPLSIVGKNGRISFSFPDKETGASIVSFSSPGGSETASTIFGGVDGSLADSLTLNFNRVHIPTGEITIGENKRYMSVPSMKTGTEGLGFVGTTTRKPAFDLNNGALIGANQLVFARPSRGRDNSILFPKNYAGNSQPTEVGYYHYLRMADGEMYTDTAIASDQSYFKLNGVKVFFSATDPGKNANEGDIWIKV